MLCKDLENIVKPWYNDNHLKLCNWEIFDISDTFDFIRNDWISNALAWNSNIAIIWKDILQWVLLYNFLPWNDLEATITKKWDLTMLNSFIKIFWLYECFSITIEKCWDTELLEFIKIINTTWFPRWLFLSFENIYISDNTAFLLSQLLINQPLMDQVWIDISTCEISYEWLKQILQAALKNKTKEYCEISVNINNLTSNQQQELESICNSIHLNTSIIINYYGG